MTTQSTQMAPEVRELAVVTEDMAACGSDEDARAFLQRVLVDHGTECAPTEASEGILSFVTRRDGRGWTLVYQAEPIGSEGGVGFVRVTGATVIRNEAYDVDLREYGQYRITFHSDAADRIDPFEFAWLLSRHDVDVVGKNERPQLFVRVPSRASLGDFCRDANREFGALVFESVEGAGRCGYEELDEL